MNLRNAITAGILGLAISGALPWTSAVAQKAADTVRVPFIQPIIGPLLYTGNSGETAFAQEMVFDELVAFDENAFKIVPLLAKSWKNVDDLTLELELRDDVKWHDGVAFSADDVVFTLMWLAKTDNKLRIRYWDWVKQVEKISPTKIRIISTEPTPTAVARLATLTVMLPAHLLSQGQDLNTFAATPVGTGMYRAVDVNRNRHIIVERNEAFRHGGTAKPQGKIKNIQMLFLPDEGAKIAQFLAGGLDVLRDIDYGQAVDLTKSSGTVMTMSEGMQYDFIILDAAGKSGFKPLQDVRVRRAILMGINRDETQILRSGTYPLQRKLEGMCYRFQTGCDYTVVLPKYDPEGAKKLLAEAGYPNGFEVELSAVNTNRNVAILISGHLAKIGIKANIDILTLATSAKKQGDGKMQLSMGIFNAGGMPDVAGTSTYLYDSPIRDYNNDDEMKMLTRVVNTEMNPTKRADAGRALFSLTTERAYVIPVSLAVAPFVHNKDLEIGGSALHGYAMHIWNVKWK